MNSFKSHPDASRRQVFGEGILGRSEERHDGVRRDPLRWTACPDCATVQREPGPGPWTRLRCATCRSVLENRLGHSVTAALACSVAAVLLLIPANLLPFLTTSILGVSRQSHLLSSATVMFGNGWPDLALVIFACAVVFPFVRFGLLALVLGVLRTRHRPGWLGRAFRIANALQTWAMPDVFLLGLAVTYGRLAAQVGVHIEAGAICLIAAALAALFVRAVLDKGEVWRAIRPDASHPAGTEAVSCIRCDIALPIEREGLRCPRCAALLRRRKANPMGRAIALSSAAALLYLPANLYPMASLPNGLSTSKYTVIGGVVELLHVGLYGLAALVLTASFVIPMLKLAGLAWCVVSVLRRSQARLVAKTRVYHAVEEVGRWSMVDPFVIACFVPVTQFNSLVYGRAEFAAPLFTAVVILTIAAADAFDPRLMWDAARKTA